MLRHCEGALAASGSVRWRHSPLLDLRPVEAPEERVHAHLGVQLAAEPEGSGAAPTAAADGEAAASQPLKVFGCCYLGREAGGPKDWHCDHCRKWIHFGCEPTPASKDGGKKMCQSCVDEMLAAPPAKKRRTAAMSEGRYGALVLTCAHLDLCCTAMCT